MAAKKTPLKLSTQEIGELERMARSQTVEHRRVVRAQIILRLSKGESLSAVARTVGLSRRIIMKWDKRFRDKRVEGLARKTSPLQDALHPGSLFVDESSRTVVRYPEEKALRSDKLR